MVSEVLIRGTEQILAKATGNPNQNQHQNQNVQMISFKRHSEGPT
jgi:hypothetical protein